MKVTWNDASQWCVELHFGDECRALDVGTARAFYAQLDDVLLLEVGGYYSRHSDLITDPLPGLNPDVIPWSAPEVVPDSVRAALESEVLRLAPGISRLNDGSSAIVLSPTNGGRANTYGAEFTLSAALAPGLRVDLWYSFFDFEITNRVTPIASNTPRHGGAVALAYADGRAVELGARLALASGFRWITGRWDGPVPPRRALDAWARYRLTDGLALHVVGMNLLDRKHYDAFGASVVGRRIVGGLTAAF